MFINFNEKINTETIEQDLSLISFNNKFFKVCDDNYYFAIDRVRNNFLIKYQEDSTHFYIGRDFKKNESNDLASKASRKFPYVEIEINKSSKECFIENDSLGVFQYFYTCTLKGYVFVTNDLKAIKTVKEYKENLSILESSYYSLLTFGYTLPGLTLYKDIMSSSLLNNLEISVKGVTLISRQIVKPVGLAKTPEAFYSLIVESTQEILRTSEIKWVNLTGGMDTRLILSTISPEQRNQLTFVFDAENIDPTYRAKELPIVMALAKKYNLNIQLFPPVGDHMLPLREYSYYTNLLTGMFGGESLGGQALVSLPDIVNLEDKSIKYNTKKLNEELNDIKEKVKKYLGVSSDYYFTLYQFLCASNSRIYDDYVWASPITLAQKKLSPFLNLKMLSSLVELDEDEITHYKFYYKIYESCASEYLDFPFHSGATICCFPRVKKGEFEDVPFIHNSKKSYVASKEYLHLSNIDEMTTLNESLSTSCQKVTSFIDTNFLRNI